MTLPTEDETSDNHKFNDERDTVVARAKASGLDFSIGSLVGGDDGDTVRHYLELLFPNGRSKRAVFVGPNTANRLLVSKFENWVFLGEFQAIFNRPAGYVEALVSSTLGGASIRLGDLLCLPGAELLNRETGRSISLGTQRTLFDEDELAINEASLRRKRVLESGETWRLRIETEGSPIIIEISETSPQFANVFSRLDVAGTLANFASLKMFGVDVLRHDDALAMLEDYATSLFFEMDLRFGMSLSLSRRRLRLRTRRNSQRTNAEGPIELPRQKYAREAVTLYSYGRGAYGTPLLQYLAYYQAIEFFFPSFFHAKLIGRIRNELRDVRFNKENDSDIQRILQVASQANPKGASEREQLRATVDSCLEDDVVREFINGNSEMREFLEKRNQIKDVPPVAFKSPTPIIDQLVDRIYSLRCRIVHTKQDGGPTATDVLLPFSGEANKMVHDLELIQFVCQKIIISGSRGVLWQ